MDGNRDKDTRIAMELVDSIAQNLTALSKPSGILALVLLFLVTIFITLFRSWLNNKHEA
jgi:hypothetical protein